MMKNLGVVLMLGILGAAYSGIYNMIDDHHRGLLIFGSLAAMLMVQRVKG